MKKRKFLFLFCSIFLFGHLFAEGFESKLKFAVGTFSTNAIALDDFHVQLGYEFEVEPFCGDMVIQGATESVAFSTNTSYRFLDFKHFKAFARGFFCVEFVTDEKVSTDTFWGLGIKVPTGNIFCFTTDFFTGIKTSKIFAMPDFPAILNADFSCSAIFAWKVFKTTEIAFSIASYETFYHPSFFAPIFTLSVSHEVQEIVLVGAELVVRTIDFFMLSSYIDSVAIRIRMECRLK